MLTPLSRLTTSPGSSREGASELGILTR